ncbi:hypothetical protein U1Q18_049028, partial [Sarracenia purpurea var. burkii]
RRNPLLLCTPGVAPVTAPPIGNQTSVAVVLSSEIAPAISEACNFTVRGNRKDGWTVACGGNTTAAAGATPCVAASPPLVSTSRKPPETVFFLRLFLERLCHHLRCLPQATGYRNLGFFTSSNFRRL